MLTPYRAPTSGSMLSLRSARAAWGAGRTLGRAVQRVRARSGRSSRSSAGSALAGPSENTFQHDVQHLYRYKRMPRRRRRGIVRRKRAFDSQLNRRLPLRTFVKTTQEDRVSVVDQQGYHYSVCCALRSNDQPDLNDDIQDIVRQTVDQADSTDVQKISNKIFIKSVQLETIIRNIGTAAVFLDAYKVYCRKDVPVIDTRTTNAPGDINQNTSIDEMLVNGYVDTLANTGWNGPRAYLHGVTPFQNPTFCHYFKIVSKTRYRIASGDTIQLHMRKKVGKTYDHVLHHSLAYKAGWTAGWVFIWYGVPSSAASPTTGLYSEASTLRIVRNVQYTYRYLQGGFYNYANFKQTTV